MEQTNVQQTPVEAPDHEPKESADHVAADLLNIAMRKSKSPSKSTGIVSGILDLLRTPLGNRGRQEDREGTQRHGYVQDQEESESNWNNQAHVELAATDTTITVPNGAIVPENRRKRKQPPERPDEYEVPVSTHMLVEEEVEVSTRPRKQVKRSARRKAPIVLPRTSRGPSTRSKAVIENTAGPEIIETFAKAPQTPIDGPGASSDDLTPDKEKKEGALHQGPKQVNPSRLEVVIPVLDKRKKPTSHSRKSQHSNIDPAIRSATKHYDPSLQQHIQQSAGDTELFLDPSPKKVFSSASIQRPALRTAENHARSEEVVLSRDCSPSPDLEDKSGNNENTDLADTSETEPQIFDQKRLESMVADSKRVGYHYSRIDETWEKRRTETTIYTSLGKRIMPRLTSLLSTYLVLKKSKGTSTSQPAPEIRLKIARELKAIQDDVNKILTTRLGNPSKGIQYFGETSTITILTDLYFHIIPSLLTTIQAASDAYTLRTSIDTAALQEIFDLVDMLRELAETTRKQKDQPVPITKKRKAAPKSRSYQIVQPTRNILVDLRDFWRSLSAELKRRRDIETRDELEASKIEQEKERQRQEKKEEAEKQRRTKQIHKSQSQNMIKQLEDPVWGEILAASIMQEEAKLPKSGNTALQSRLMARIRRVEYPRSQDMRRGSQRSVKSRSASDLEFLNDDSNSYQRVSVFEKNNKSQQNEPRPWSGEEKTMFIEFLQLNRGRDRYERLAEMLERSIEEIFASAKDLQEAMDHAHEKGVFNDESDQWTYEVWIAPKRPF